MLERLLIGKKAEKITCRNIDFEPSICIHPLINIVSTFKITSKAATCAMATPPEDLMSNIEAAWVH